jgi:Zn-dependent protease
MPDLQQQLVSAGIAFVVLLCSLALHEFAHAWTADKRHDPLPRTQGRVTLDPLAHLDPIGSFLIPGVMIFLPLFLGAGSPIALLGWGKPVQISLPNPETRRKDDILITLAGPGMNLLIAFVLSVVAGLLIRFGSADASEFVHRAFGLFFLPAITINLCLAVFNLVPIPPLDGSHVLRHIVGMGEETYFRLSRNGWWILLLLINFPFFRKSLTWAIGCAWVPFGELISLIAEA